ncbi:MAG TPA: M14 family metallocarboxypeptidase [Methylomirabilota bacterium]|nr:M14 family metallocarboxypeptidase [Methylomirabilota bacterium]
MQRLRRNRGGYFGERLDVGAYLREADRLARASGWEIDRLPADDKPPLTAFRRPAPDPRLNLYVSTGIHGDEPAGPRALLELMGQHPWPDDVSLWICPCLNPTGFDRGTRENADGVDLNRDYRELKTAEVRAHVEWLKRQPEFDLALCLHEDWEANGFYVYELNPLNRESFAGAMIERVRRVCPIEDAGTVDGRPAEGGIIRPREVPSDRPQWPEAIFLNEHKTRLGYTLEAPSDYELNLRTQALVEGVKAVCERLRARGREEEV